MFWSPVDDSDGAAILALTPILGKDLMAPSPLLASSIVLCLVPLLWAWSWEAELTATLQREQYRRRIAFASSVSSSGAFTSPSFCASFSAVLGMGDKDASEGAFTVSVEPLLNGAISEVGFGDEGSPDVVSELEGCEHDDNRTAVSLETSSQVLIFESGASRDFSFFACFVPL